VTAGRGLWTRLSWLVDNLVGARAVGDVGSSPARPAPMTHIVPPLDPWLSSRLGGVEPGEPTTYKVRDTRKSMQDPASPLWRPSQTPGRRRDQIGSDGSVPSRRAYRRARRLERRALRSERGRRRGSRRSVAPPSARRDACPPPPRSHRWGRWVGLAIGLVFVVRALMWIVLEASSRF